MKRISDEMRRVHRKLNHWLRNFDEDPWDFEEPDFSGYRKAWVDARELENEFVIAVELPGVNKDDIEVNINENILTIRVEKKQEHQEENKEEGFCQCEKSYTGFYRRIPLPRNADAKNIDAQYKAGILKLTIPKKIEEKKGTSIKIK